VTAVVVRGGRRGTLPRALPLLVAGLLVLCAIAYPLATDGDRDTVTWAIVLLGAVLSVVHAAVSRGGRTAAAVLLLVAVTAIGFESVGLATGFPYGT